MSELDDHDLLARYARENSEAAFAALAERHVNLVYSVALRSTGNPHAAQEITQAVFIILANKAEKLSRRVVLSGWLYQTTRLTAANFMRGEIRRQKREQEAYMESTLNGGGDAPSPSADQTIWPQIAPLLDDALARLGERDRNAVILRFFENKSLREVGLVLGASEDAAKMRVNRALEKLRKIFGKRGVTFSVAAIAGTVSTNSVHAAPVGLAKTISVVAVAKGAAAGGSTLALVKGALKIMAWTKAKTAIVVSATILLATGTATLTFPKIRHAYLEHKVVWTLDDQALEKEPPVVLIRPAQPIPGVIGGGGYIRGGPSTSGKMIGLKMSVLSMLQLAYQDPTYSGSIHADRVIVPVNLPKQEYDFIACTPKLQREALQQALKNTFGLVGHLETRDTDVLLLEVKNPDAAGLKLSKTARGSTYETQGKLSIRGGSLSLMAGFIEDSVLQIPVIDRTGLTNMYDLDLTWNVKGRNWTMPSRPILDRILADQLGLELVPTNMPMEMLVVEKAKN